MAFRVSFGNGGWVAVEDAALPGPLYVRVREIGGRLRVGELYLETTDGVVDGSDLRQLPLSNIESLIDANADAVRQRINLPAPDMATLATHYASGSWAGPEHTCKTPRTWIDDMFDSQIEGSGVPKVKRARRGRFVEPQPDEFRLSSGPVDGLTDGFFRDLARAYNAAVSRGERPNKAIAEQTGYNVKTAQGWIYLARKAGVMPPGRKGRAG